MMEQTRIVQRTIQPKDVMCLDCAHFQQRRCSVGYRTTPYRKPCRQFVSKEDMRKAEKRWSW